MGPLDLADHVLSFAAPAFVVAILATLASPWLLPRGPRGLGARGRFAISFVAGLAAMGAGLWYFGHDGKMASYAALVLAVATSQWLAGQGWRS